jgi:PAS domain S-box-containing protein
MPEAVNDQLLDSVPDGVFTVDAGWRITAFNRTAEQITGIRRAEALGRRCCDVFRASICESACALKQTLATERPVVNKVVYIIDGKGQKIPISISTAVLKDERGKVVGGVESFRDLRLGGVHETADTGNPRAESRLQNPAEARASGTSHPSPRPSPR